MAMAILAGKAVAGESLVRIGANLGEGLPYQSLAIGHEVIAGRRCTLGGTNAGHE